MGHPFFGTANMPLLKRQFRAAARVIFCLSMLLLACPSTVDSVQRENSASGHQRSERVLAYEADIEALRVRVATLHDRQLELIQTVLCVDSEAGCRTIESPIEIAFGEEEDGVSPHLALSSQFDEEEVDESWAPRIESLFWEGFQNPPGEFDRSASNCPTPLAGVVSLDVECRTTLCRLRAVHASLESVDCLHRAATVVANYSELGTVAFAAVTQRDSEIFVIRRGHEEPWMSDQ